MAWVIHDSKTGLYYSVSRRWTGTPKIYAKEGWAKSALTGWLKRHRWSKTIQASDYSVVPYRDDKFADVNIYEANCIEFAAVYINGEYVENFGDYTVTAQDLEKLLRDYEYYKIHYFKLGYGLCEFFHDNDDQPTEEQLKQWIIEE